MNKDELIELVKELKLQIKSLTHNNTFLLKQQKEFKKYAEDAGGESAKWKHKCLILEEQLRKVKQ